MKKQNRWYRSLAGLLAVGTMCASMPALNFSAVQTMAGDVDLDNAVTESDVQGLQSYLLGTAKLSQNAYDNADLTGDGVVNVFDLGVLKKMVSVTPISNEVYIYLSDNGITVEGDDNGVVQISGKTAKITGSGLYHVYGTITEGQIYVETAAEDVSDVELELNDVTMTNSTMSCIYTSAASGSEKTKITVNGTNTLTDTAAAAYAESGVIYTNNKLTITKSSTGSLNINSAMNTGIYADKKMNLNGGTINVNTSDSSDTADADAIVGDNNIEIEGAVIDIDSSADGIKSKDQGVYLLDGTVTVKAGNDAVQACTEIAVSGGTLIAGGDRGFRLDEAGLLNITGGKVIATATDYQVTGSGVTVNTAGTTQPTMMMDMAAEWTKSDAITIGSNTYQPNKKYSYVLISDSALSASSTYQVSVGGYQMNHSTDASGNFQNTATITQYYSVAAMGETTTTTTGTIATISYSSSGVALYDASGNAVSADDSVSVSGSEVTILKAGVYEVNGSSSNGRIVVNTDDTAEPTALVELDLTGLELSNSTMAPIFVENVGDECVIVAKSGSVNTISDGTSHTDTQTNSEGTTETVNGAIYACDDLKIKGTGSLTVNGNTADGIVCKNDLKIWNGNLTVNAVDDCLRGNDSVTIGDADDTDFSSLKVTLNSSAGDGVKTNATDTAEGEGAITVNGGTTNITAYSDGFHASMALTMNGGDVTVTTTCTGSSSSTASDVSAKGLKAGCTDDVGTVIPGELVINGGTMNLKGNDDTIHATNVTIEGGNITAACNGQDGIHADNNLYINDGTINITKSYEAIEGVYIYVNGGNIHMTATDDGFNAAGGADGSGGESSGNGGFGGGAMSTTYGELYIKGGYVFMQANGDGLDANGPMYLQGGTVVVNGFTSGDTSPIDADSGVTYSGGTVLAYGASNMAVYPSSYSFLTTSANISAGTRVTFTNASGTVLSTVTVPSGSAGQYLVYCSSESSVTCYTGGTVSGVTMVDDYYGEGGTISGGTQLSSSGTGSQNPWG